jgi:hypothetical protein
MEFQEFHADYFFIISQPELHFIVYLFFLCRNDQKDGVSFWAQINDSGTEVVTQPAGAGTAKLQNTIRGIRIYKTLVNHAWFLPSAQ